MQRTDQKGKGRFWFGVFSFDNFSLAGSQIGAELLWLLFLLKASGPVGLGSIASERAVKQTEPFASDGNAAKLRPTGARRIVRELDNEDPEVFSSHDESGLKSWIW